MNSKHQYILGIILSLIIIPISSQCQTEKGKFLLGGSFGIKISSHTNSSSGLEYTENTLNISPEISFFLIKNLSIGIGVPYNHTSAVFGGNGWKFNGIGYNVSARYYIGSKNIKPFAIAKVGRYHSKTSTSNSEFKFSHLFLDLGGGFAFFARKKVSFNIYGGYRYEDNKDPWDMTSNGFFTRFGIDIVL